MKIKTAGFTLVELLMVLVIVGMLTAIAIPSYRGHVLKGHRSQAIIFLQDLAFRQETYYNMNGRYGWLANLDSNGLGVEERNGTRILSNGTLVIEDRYRLTNGRGNDTFWYRLQAVGDQLADADCRFIRINQDWQLNDGGTTEERFCSST